MTEMATSPNRRAVVDRLLAGGAVAVVRWRADSDDRAHTRVDALAAALVAGGVTAIEVTLTTPGALAMIERLSRDSALLVGAGSVLDAPTARDAVSAGARYVVSPVFDDAVLAAAHAHDVPVCPGAYTPTELLHAHRVGADVVKLFPAEALGPAFIKGVLAPMPFLRIMPTGGVTPDNVGTWIRAGAVAVGLGTALVDPALVAAGHFTEITARARRTTQGIADARAERLA